MKTASTIPALRWSQSPAFRALRLYNYRLYWSGLLISQIGSWMARVAQGWLVLELTGSSVALGTVTALQALPISCLTLFAGVLIDSVPKHRLIIITQTLAMVQAFLMAALTLGGWMQVWHLYLLAFLLGLTNALDIPGRQAFVVELVGRDNLVNAVGLNSTLFNSARLVGPAIGGVIISWVGVGGCFLVNGISFLAVLVCLLKMRPQEFHQTAHPPLHGPVLAQLREGVAYSLRTPPVLLSMILIAIVGTFGYNFGVTLPLLARDAMGVGAVGYGALYSAVGLGSIISALVFAARGRSSARAMLLGATVFTTTQVLAAFAPWYPLSLVLLVVVGIASIVFSTSANTSIQLNVPDVLRGRVMSIYVFLFAGMAPVGSMVIGSLAAALGIRAAMGVACCICLTGVTVGLLYLRGHRPAGSPVE